ncbi:hypothetical protein RJT34_11470 [Clitoria ternatea]|uniref:Uncharacterized protein n=1 Tax=Clitoria ternatea TaxID=43366 RepID=A0AAN9JMK8_CLITE
MACVEVGDGALLLEELSSFPLLLLSVRLFCLRFCCICVSTVARFIHCDGLKSRIAKTTSATIAIANCNLEFCTIKIQKMLKGDWGMTKHSIRRLQCLRKKMLKTQMPIPCMDKVIPYNNLGRETLEVLVLI